MNAADIFSALTTFATGQTGAPFSDFNSFDPTGRLTASVLDDPNHSYVSTSTYAYSPDGKTVTITTTDPSGYVTQTTTDTVNTFTGAASEDVKNLNHQGAVLNEQVISTPSSSSVINDTVSGTGGVVTTSGENITLNANTSATVAGSADVVGFGGSGDTVNANGETIKTNSAGETGEVINGSNNTVTESTSSSIQVNGNNDAISVGAAGYVRVSGNADTVNAVHGTVDLGPNTSATVTGTGNTIGFSGSGDTLTTSSETVKTNQANDVGELLVGSNDTVTESSGCAVVINGNNETVTLASGAYVGLNGTGEVVNATGASMDLGSNSGATVNGVGNTVGFDGTGDTLKVSGSTVVADINNATGETLNGSNDTVNETSGSSIVVNGGSDVITLASGAYVLVNGVSNTINANGNHIDLAGNSSVVVNGAGDTVGLSGIRDTVTASNDVIVTNSSNEVTEVLYGNSDIVTLSAGSSISVTGNSDTLNLVAGDTVTSLAGSQEDIYGTGAMITLTGANTSVTDFGSGNRISATTGDTVGATNDTIILQNANDNITVNGIYDTFTSGTAGDVVIDNLPTTGSVVDTWVNGVEQSVDYTGTNGTGTIDGYGANGPPDPVILNLNGGQVQTTSLSASIAYFDMQNDGYKERTGWATTGEGMLVYDPTNPDARITHDSQFVAGTSVLQGMDSNHDGVLNVSDSAWKDLRVWVTDGTANFKEGQLQTLSGLGISSITLDAAQNIQNNNGNTVLSESTFTWANGNTGDLDGVALATGAPRSGLSASSLPLQTLVGVGSLNLLIQRMAALTDGEGGGELNFLRNSEDEFSGLLATPAGRVSAMLNHGMQA